VKLIVFVTGKTKTQTQKQFTPWGVTFPIPQPYEQTSPQEDTKRSQDNKKGAALVSKAGHHAGTRCAQ